MIQNRDQIISEYREADFNRRLHLYLQYPHLRSKFILIDQNDLKMDVGTDFKTRRSVLAAQLSGVLCSAAGCFKKLLGMAAT